MSTATALAHSNIALAKYWGKADRARNLPAVPSLSLTLAGLTTRTTVEVGGVADSLELDDRPVTGRPLERVSAMLDRVWRRDVPRPGARVWSTNDFPTAAGLASSASAFAALAMAANEAFGAGRGIDELSDIARAVSASAGRSLFGGFVALDAGSAETRTLAARPVAPPEHWDVRLVVAVTAEGEKEIGSTQGMNHTEETSPFYRAWLCDAPRLFRVVERAVLARDWDALGPAMEQSALAMHATALAADPGLVYWNGATVEAMRAVRALRRAGLLAYFTIDAGPHVKVLTTPADLEQVRAALGEVPGVLRTIVARPGEGARLER